MSQPKKKPLLVEYRRNSSDMDMSTSDSDHEEEGKNACSIEKRLLENNAGGDRTDGLPENTDNLVNCERLHESKIKDDSKSSDRIERKLKGRDERDSRRSHYDKSRSSPNRHERSRRSPDRGYSYHHRQRSRSPRHRRSPIRHKYSPSRRGRDRKRSPSPERSRKRSPELYRSKRLERKVARIDKLGIEIPTELRDAVSSLSSAGVNSYCNPAANNNLARITEQIQKRRLLWGNKKEVPQNQTETNVGGSGVEKAWQAAAFKGDNDGKMTEKFKRLMGMKGEAPSTSSAPSAPAGNEIIKKQEEMFSNMEAQYQVARMATHTHRGIGLGFGTFQVPPQ